MTPLNAAAPAAALSPIEPVRISGWQNAKTTTKTPDAPDAGLLGVNAEGSASVRDKPSASTREPGADAGYRSARFTRDAATDELLFQVVDMRKDEVVFQLPDEKILRMRAFYQEQEKRSAAGPGVVSRIA